MLILRVVYRRIAFNFRSGQLQHDLVEYCLSITLTIKVCNFSIVRGCNTSRVFFKHFLIVLNISHLGGWIPGFVA